MSAGVIRSTRGIVVSTALALLLGACGGGGSVGDGSTGDRGSDGSTSPPAGSDYQPLAVGDRWVYQRNDNGSTISTLEQVDVGSVSNVGGQTVASLVTSSFDGTQKDVQRYASTADGVTQYPASSDWLSTGIGPHPVLKLPVQVGGSFTQIDKTVSTNADYDGDGIPEKVLLLSTVQVISSGPLTTPAGTFPVAVHLRTTLKQTTVASASGSTSPGQAVEDNWYVAGVGLVKSDLSYVMGDHLQPVTSIVLVAWRAGGMHGGDAPTVTDVAPADGQVHNGGVAVTASFSMPMDAASLNAGGFGVVDALGNSVPGRVTLSADGMSAVFVPTAGWASGTFTATVSATATARESNAATPRAWTFTLDTVNPSLALATPPDGATSVPTNATLSYIYSEPLSPLTVMPSSIPAFTLTDDTTGQEAPALASYDGVATLSFTPRTYWTHGHSYTVTFPAGFADLVGNAQGIDRQVHFTTAPSAFTDPQPLAATIGGQPVATIGDLDGDGLPDVVWAAWDASAFPPQIHLFVRYGQAGGSFGPASEPLPAPVYACGLGTITMADTNADGRTDLVLGGNCGIRMLLQDAIRHFTTGALYPLPDLDYAAAVKFGDLDGDGRVEMLSAGNSSSFRVWTQSSPGVFQQTGFIDTGLGSLVDLRVADLDGDGIPDVVATSGGMQANRLAVLRGLPSGGFASPVPIPTAGDGWPSGLAVADVDGDGRPDIVVSIAGASSANTTTLHQNADHSFTAISSTPVALYPRGVTMADVDGDGRLDVLVGHDDAFAVMTGRGDGSFSTEDLYGAPQLDSQFGPSTSFAVGAPDASGRFVVEFNGQLFLRKSSMESQQGQRVGRPARLFDSMRVPLPSHR